MCVSAHVRECACIFGSECNYRRAQFDTCARPNSFIYAVRSFTTYERGSRRVHYKHMQSYLHTCVTSSARRTTGLIEILPTQSSMTHTHTEIHVRRYSQCVECGCGFCFVSIQPWARVSLCDAHTHVCQTRVVHDSVMHACAVRPTEIGMLNYTEAGQHTRIVRIALIVYGGRTCGRRP